MFRDRKAVLIHLENDSSMEIKHGILQALNYEGSHIYGDKFLLLSALIYIKFQFQVFAINNIELQVTVC